MCFYLFFILCFNFFTNILNFFVYQKLFRIFLCSICYFNRPASLFYILMVLLEKYVSGADLFGIMVIFVYVVCDSVYFRIQRAIMYSAANASPEATNPVFRMRHPLSISSVYNFVNISKTATYIGGQLEVVKYPGTAFMLFYKLSNNQARHLCRVIGAKILRGL